MGRWAEMDQAARPAELDWTLWYHLDDGLMLMGT